MRRQRTEVVVELRKVNTFRLLILSSATNNVQEINYLLKVQFWPLYLQFIIEITYLKMLISRISAGMYTMWYYCSLHLRTKETSTFWRGETCPTRTSARTLTSTEISDRYGCLSSAYSSSRKHWTLRVQTHIKHDWPLRLVALPDWNVHLAVQIFNHSNFLVISWRLLSDISTAARCSNSLRDRREAFVEKACRTI